MSLQSEELNELVAQRLKIVAVKKREPPCILFVLEMDFNQPYPPFISLYKYIWRNGLIRSIHQENLLINVLLFYVGKKNRLMRKQSVNFYDFFLLQKQARLNI